jgi:ribonuclease HI
MTTSLRIWARSSHHAAFRCGGWAWVRQDGHGEPVGQAGGERNTTAPRMALAALAAALKDAPKGPLTLDLADLALARAVHRIAQGPAFTPEEAPAEDLDLWAQLTTALAGRQVAFTPAAAAPFKGGPAAFAQAWADLAQDKAKAAGPFAAAIPRANLAKVRLD